jgi:hypothetical protein
LTHPDPPRPNPLPPPRPSERAAVPAVEGQRQQAGGELRNARQGAPSPRPPGPAALATAPRRLAARAGAVPGKEHTQRLLGSHTGPRSRLSLSHPPSPPPPPPAAGAPHRRGCEARARRRGALGRRVDRRRQPAPPLAFCSPSGVPTALAPTPAVRLFLCPAHLSPGPECGPGLPAQAPCSPSGRPASLTCCLARTQPAPSTPPPSPKCATGSETPPSNARPRTLHCRCGVLVQTFRNYSSGAMRHSVGAPPGVGRARAPRKPSLPVVVSGRRRRAGAGLWAGESAWDGRLQDGCRSGGCRVPPSEEQ